MKPGQLFIAQAAGFAGVARVLTISEDGKKMDVEIVIPQQALFPPGETSYSARQLLDMKPPPQCKRIEESSFKRHHDALLRQLGKIAPRSVAGIKSGRNTGWREDQAELFGEGFASLAKGDWRLADALSAYVRRTQRLPRDERADWFLVCRWFNDLLCWKTPAETASFVNEALGTRHSSAALRKRRERLRLPYLRRTGPADRF